MLASGSSRSPKVQCVIIIIIIIINNNNNNNKEKKTVSARLGVVQVAEGVVLLPGRFVAQHLVSLPSEIIVVVVIVIIISSSNSGSSSRSSRSSSI